MIKLLNQSQAKAKRELASLEEQLEQAEAALLSNNSVGKSRPRALQLLLDAPDDLDEPSKEPIALQDVEALAQGRRTQSAATARKPILDPTEVVSASTLKKQAEDYQQRRKDKPKGSRKKASASEKDDDDDPHLPNP